MPCCALIESAQLLCSAFLSFRMHIWGFGLLDMCTISLRMNIAMHLFRFVGDPGELIGDSQDVADEGAAAAGPASKRRRETPSAGASGVRTLQPERFLDREISYFGAGGKQAAFYIGSRCVVCSTVQCTPTLQTRFFPTYG